MDFLEDNQIGAWAEERALQRGAGSTLQLPELESHPRKAYANGHRSGREASAARDRRHRKNDIQQQHPRLIGELMLDIFRRADEPVAIVKGTCAPEEAAAYSRSVGHVAGAVVMDLLEPLYKKTRSSNRQTGTNEPYQPE